MLLGSTITKTLHFPLLFQTDSVTDTLVGVLDGLFCIFLNLHIKLEIVGFFFLYLVSVVGSFIYFWLCWVFISIWPFLQCGE